MPIQSNNYSLPSFRRFGRSLYGFGQGLGVGAGQAAGGMFGGLAGSGPRGVDPRFVQNRGAFGAGQTVGRNLPMLAGGAGGMGGSPAGGLAGGQASALSAPPAAQEQRQMLGGTNQYAGAVPTQASLPAARAIAPETAQGLGMPMSAARSNRAVSPGGGALGAAPTGGAPMEERGAELSAPGGESSEAPERAQRMAMILGVASMSQSYAGAGPTGREQRALGMYSRLARGRGPSLAAMLAQRQATEANMQAQALASAYGGPNQALALRQAQTAGAQMQRQVAADAAAQRAQEQLSAYAGYARLAQAEGEIQRRRSASFGQGLSGLSAGMTAFSAPGGAR